MDGAGGKEPVDIEHLIQWAVSRTGRLPWEGTRDVDLFFDRGLTAKPRRRPPGNWIIAAACAGMRFGSGRVMAPKMVPGGDAERVIAEIKALPADQAALVLRHGRQRSRPDWMEGIEPRRVERRIYPKRRGKRTHRPVVIWIWEPEPPTVVAAARAAYRSWHDGLATVAARLDGQLDRWSPRGPVVLREPWLVLHSHDVGQSVTV